MQETDYKSPLDEFCNNEWGQLSNYEKALCLNYRRQLLEGIKVKSALILEINEVHRRHPDFHVGCIPNKRDLA